MSDSDNKPAAGPVTDAAADFLASVSYGDLPATVRRQTARVLADSVACAVGGASVPAGRALLSPYRHSGNGWIHGSEGPVRDVAAANAQAANILDFDTTYRNIGHPGAIAACTALTVGAKQGTSGKRVLTALAAGYELAARIGEGLQPSRDRREIVWPWASWHVFAASGATAVLRDLSPAACRQSVNLAAGTAPVSMVNRILELPSTIVKNANLWVTRTGVEAVTLAERGMRGPACALDGPDGFHAAAGADQWSPEAVVDRLTDPTDWALERVSFKPYPICRWTHSCVDAAYQLRERGVEPDAITTITVDTIPRLSQPPHDNLPTDHADATWSVQWGIGSALTGLEPGAVWYEADRFEDDALHDVMACITIKPNESYGERFPDALPANVTAETPAGVEVATVEYPTGSPSRPIEDADLREKASRLLDGSSVSVEELRDIESIDDVSVIVSSI